MSLAVEATLRRELGLHEGLSKTPVRTLASASRWPAHRHESMLQFGQPTKWWEGPKPDVLRPTTKPFLWNCPSSIIANFNVVVTLLLPSVIEETSSRRTERIIGSGMGTASLEGINKERSGNFHQLESRDCDHEVFLPKTCHLLNSRELRMFTGAPPLGPERWTLNCYS